MGYTIDWADGQSGGSADTYDAAIAAIEAEYPEAEIGHDGDLSEGGDCTRCWADDDSARDDAGARAIATIRRG